jgi:hypothetical protein
VVETPVLIPTQSLHERVLALLSALVGDSRINVAFRPVILNLAKNFLADVDDKDLRDGLLKVRDKIIPWLLSEGGGNEDPTP